MKKYLLTAFYLFYFILAFAQNSEILSQKKKEFFPMELGNKYYYSTWGGRGYKNLLRKDTLIITGKRIDNGYTVIALNKIEQYWVKGDSVFAPDYSEDGKLIPNLLYYKVEKTSEHNLHSGSCGISGSVVSSSLGNFKIENTTYINCYKFLKCLQYCEETIVVNGIGLFQTVRNEEKTVLTGVELN